MISCGLAIISNYAILAIEKRTHKQMTLLQRRGVWVNINI